MNNDKSIQNVQIVILSYALYEKKYIDTILNRLNCTFFTSNAYKKTFSLIQKYWDKHRTCVNYNVLENLFKIGRIQNDTWVDFISIYPSCSDLFIKDEGDLDANINLLINFKKRHLISHYITEISNNNSDLDKVLESVKKWNLENESLMNNKNEKITSVDPFTDESITNRINAYTNPDVYQDLIRTGFEEIDKKIGGMQKSELTYIIGRKGHGKSILMQNLGYNMWKQENNILFITLEIKHQDYLKRIDSFYTRINALKFKIGIKEEDEVNNLKDTLNKLKEGYDENGIKHSSKFIVEETNINSSVNKIEQLIKKSEERYGLKYDVIILDYASLLQPNIQQREERHKHGQIAQDLKDLAKKTNKLIITGAQMNRIGEKSEFASASNVAESDSVFNPIDWGMEIMLNPDLTKNIGKIRSSKCRDGEHFEFEFIKKYETFRIEENVFGELGKDLEKDEDLKGWNI